jgi:uncharacterized membrane protein YdjX (TVP38/TMEM64 family)
MTDIAMSAYGGAVALHCPRTGRMRLTSLPPAQRRTTGPRFGTVRRAPRQAHPRGTGYPLHAEHANAAPTLPVTAAATTAATAPDTAPDTAPAAVAVPVARRLRGRLGRALLLVAGVGAVGGAAVALPLHELPQFVAGLGPAAAVAVAVVGGLLLSVLIPRTAITLACGALLGVTAGACASLAAAVISAVATYYLGRWAGRGALAARAGGRLDRLDGWLNRRGFSAVLLVRFLPLAPYGLVGYAYGTTSVRPTHYLLGTTLAAIPSTITYAIIGAAVTQPGRMSPVTLAPAAIGFLLSTIIVWNWKRTSRRAAAA